MSGDGPPRNGLPGTRKDTDAETQVLQLHKEDVAVSKRVRKTLVRAIRRTRTRDILVEENLHHDQVIVEQVAIGRVVDVVPPVRQEGDVTILSVVEEIVVVERRLVLKEEVHLRRVRRTESYVETVKVREQDVTVTRTDLEPLSGFPGQEHHHSIETKD